MSYRGNYIGVVRGNRTQLDLEKILFMEKILEIQIYLKYFNLEKDDFLYI